jgi:hypothetical protein
MGTELVTETSENLHILTRLPARENFIRFCRRETFKDFCVTLVTANRNKVYRKEDDKLVSGLRYEEILKTSN